MSDSDVYLPSKDSLESCDTSYSSGREETEVARILIEKNFFSLSAALP